MSDIHARFPLLLFMKAVTKKQVWVPGYTKRNGTVVSGHMHWVNVSTDHDEHAVVSGNGTVSQKKAHEKLSKKDWFQALPHDHKHAVILHHGTKIADEKYITDQLSRLKHNITKDKKVLTGEWKVYQAADEAKRKPIDDAIKAAGKWDSFQESFAAWDKANSKPAEAVEAAAAPEPVAAPAKEPEKAPEPAKEPKHKLPEGWTGSPTGLITNVDQKAGGIIDNNKDGWFVIPSDDEIASIHDLPTQKDAIEALAIAVAKQKDKEEAKAKPAEKPKAEPVKLSTLAADNGPKDGDTKEGADGTLVFKDGHWHKKEEPKAEAPKVVAASEEAKPLASWPTRVPEGGGMPVAVSYKDLPKFEGEKDVKLQKKIDKIAKLAIDGDAQGLHDYYNKLLEPKAKDYAKKVVDFMAAKENGKAPAAANPDAEAIDNSLKIDADEALASGDMQTLKDIADYAAKNGMMPTAEYVAKHINALVSKQAVEEAEKKAAAKPAALNPMPTDGSMPEAPASIDAPVVKVLHKWAKEGPLSHLENYAKPSGDSKMDTEEAYAAQLVDWVHAQSKAAETAAAAKPKFTPVEKPETGGMSSLAADAIEGISGLLEELNDYPSMTDTTAKELQEYFAAFDYPKNTLDDKTVAKYAKDALASIGHEAKHMGAAAPEAPAVAAPVKPVGSTFTGAVSGIEQAYKDKDPNSEVLQNWTKFDAKGDQQFQVVVDYAKQVTAALGGTAPVKAATTVAKPHVPGYENSVNAVEQAYKEGDKPTLEAWTKEQKMGGMSQVVDYAQNCLNALNGVAPSESGPKEGDTKQGVDGMLVLKDGHWVKVGGDEKPAAAKPKLPPELAVKTVAKPKFEGKNSVKMNKTVKELQAIAIQHGAEGLKKVVTLKDTGLTKIGGEGISGWWTGLSSPNGKLLAAYAHLLIGAMEGQPGTGEAPAPKAKKVVGSTVTTSGSIDGWKQIGPQGGYNPGGTYEDLTGQKWYVKFPAGGEKIVKNELLATKLYALAGVEVPEVKIVNQNGKIGLASKIVDGAVANKSALLEGKASGLLQGFGADAWLANWDAVGNNPAAGKGFDNILIKPDGSAVRIDAGGALLYGGAGGKKQKFEDDVVELKTMLNSSINPNTAAVFGKMGQGDIAAAVAKVAAIPDSAIENVVNAFGPGNAAEKARLAAKLIARKENMIQQYPSAAKAKAVEGESNAQNFEIIQPKFEPEKISTPPDFMNWKGPGNPGPATALYKNEANQKGVQEMYEVAKSGSMEAIKTHKLPIYDAEGKVTGHTTGLEHPSQYVRNYTQQLINEVDAMSRPQKVYKLQHGSALGIIDAAHPIIKGEAVAATKKAAKYLVLGEPGMMDVDSLGLKKLTYLAGTVTDADYAKAAQKAFENMPKTQKSAIASYTANGYGGQNGSLWDGNPTGAAKAAGEALHTFAHDIKPGTVLSRRISLSGKSLEEVIGTFKGDEQQGGAVGKVLQELAIGSTSTNHDFWHGNVQLKITVGPGCKGLWVGAGSKEGGGTESSSGNEREIIFPPNYRMLVNKVKKSHGKKDDDGYGGPKSDYVVEVLLLPTQE